MNKKSIILITVIIIFIIGCTPKSEEEVFYDVQRRLHKIQSYYCKVKITSIGNKGPEYYVMKQWFKKPNKYKLEIILPKNMKGKTTISNGHKIWIYYPSIEQTWVMKNHMNAQEQNMFLGYFMKNCLNSEDVQISKRTVQEEEYLIINTSIPGNHPYYYKESLWIHSKTHKPFLLQVFDAQKNKRIEVEYYDFQYNLPLEDTFFYFQEK